MTPGASWSISEQGTLIEGGRWSGTTPLVGEMGSAALVEPQEGRDVVDVAASSMLATQTMTPLELAQLLHAALSSDAAPLVAAAQVSAGAHPRPASAAAREMIGSDRTGAGYQRA